MKFLLLFASLFAWNGYASEDCSPMLKPKSEKKCLKLNHPADGENIKEMKCTWDKKRDVKCECCVLND